MDKGDKQSFLAVMLAELNFKLSLQLDTDSITDKIGQQLLTSLTRTT
jgi:hypothetical protein